MGKELAATKEWNSQLKMEVAWLKEAAAGDKKALAKVQKKHEATEGRLKTAELKRGALSSTLAWRNQYFAQKGAEVSSFLSTLLGEVGAHVPPFEVMEDGNPEDSFFAWLEAQLPAVPSVNEKSYKFSLLLSAEAALNLMERRDCEHVGNMAEPMIVTVGEDSREVMSEAVERAAHRVVAEYWVAHGREAARANVVARLGAVSPTSFPPSPLGFSLFSFEPLLSFSVVSPGSERRSHGAR